MTKREEIRVKGLPEAISHYVDAVRFGDLVFISGLTGFDENLTLVGGDDVAEQTRQVFRSLKLILDEVGATYADVLRVNVFLTDINDRAAVNEVRQEFFKDAYPASTLIGVNALVLPEIKVEIEAVVGLPG